MKQFYFALLLVLSPITLFAQETNVEQEIREYNESQSQLISKARRLLLDKFIEGDMAKVKEVKDYLLNTLENEEYTGLFAWELWMIKYWTGEYETLPQAVLDFNENTLQKYRRRISPPQDMLYLKLVERSWDNLRMLEDAILASTQDEETKDFLLLHLNYMVSGEPLLKLGQEDVNTMADLYLETHPESSYENYVRNNIRYRYVPSNWGFGFSFFMGYNQLTGDLNELYGDGGALGMDFDVAYKKFTLYLRNYIGFGTTQQERENNNVVWVRGSQYQSFLPEASIGYAVIENDRWKISPFAGIGGASITAATVDTEKRPELEAMEVGFSTAYTLGLNLDLKLRWQTTPLLTQSEDKSYWYLRLRYGYTMPQFNNFPGHNGNIHQITLGLGGLYRGMKREL